MSIISILNHFLFVQKDNDNFLQELWNEVKSNLNELQKK